jgi:acyl-CoA thioester hydrolase
MENLHVFSRCIRVTDHHIDALQHVNNVQYLQWMMEAAEQHWQSRALPEMICDLIWVVRRHEIDYLGQAMVGDELLLRTWTGAYSGAVWWRHFTIEQASNQSPLVTAATQFALVNRKTGKPQPIRQPTVAIFQELE